MDWRRATYQRVEFSTRPQGPWRLHRESPALTPPRTKPMSANQRVDQVEIVPTLWLSIFFATLRTLDFPK